MSRNGAPTRERILDAAQRLVLRKGFAATTVEEVLQDAASSKGAFFHHFDSKGALGRALVARYADADLALLESTMTRAERLARDPLQQLLLFVALLEEDADAISGDDPGCLLATFCYERELTDEATRTAIADTFRAWRDRIHEKLRATAALHPPRVEVDLESLADGALTAFEGAFVLSRAVSDPHALRVQLRHYRTYLELLFGTAA